MERSALHNYNPKLSAQIIINKQIRLRSNLILYLTSFAQIIISNQIRLRCNLILYPTVRGAKHP